MYKSQTNPAAVRSQELMTVALQQLVAENDYDKITVTDICAKAQVTRKTFYRNFDCKDDIIYYMLDKVFVQIEKHLDIVNNSLLEIYLKIFYFIYEHKQELMSFANKGLMRFVKNNLASFLKKEHILSKLGDVVITETDMQYLMAIVVSSFLGIIEVWMQNNFNDTPEYLAHLALKILNTTMWK